jgi:hypothetical protein
MSIIVVDYFCSQNCLAFWNIRRKSLLIILYPGHHTHHPLQVLGSTGPLTNNSNSGGHVTTTSAIVNEVSITSMFYEQLLRQ